MLIQLIQLISIFLLNVHVTHATIGANLIEAAREGHMPDIIKWLEHHDVDVKDSSHYSAFMHASMSGHLDVMQYLLDKGAKINTRDRVYHTPLILAARDGRIKVVEFLIAKGAQIEVRDNSRMTALTWASVRGNHDIMELLVKAGANIHHEDHIDHTPLDWAKKRGHDTIHDHLLSKGATTKEHRKSQADLREKEVKEAKQKRVDAAHAANAKAKIGL